MEKVTWKGCIKDGRIDEYIRRHENLPQEMAEVLARAGIVNYTVWNAGDEVFGYYECKYGAEYAKKVQAESPVVDRWNDYMEDILELPIDPGTGYQYVLKKVFEFDS